MDIRIRPFEERDHEVAASAFNRVFPDIPLTAQDSRNRDAFRRDLVSVTAETPGEGRAVGFADLWRTRT